MLVYKYYDFVGAVAKIIFEPVSVRLRELLSFCLTVSKGRKEKACYDNSFRVDVYGVEVGLQAKPSKKLQNHKTRKLTRMVSAPLSLPFELVCPAY